MKRLGLMVGLVAAIALGTWLFVSRQRQPTMPAVPPPPSADAQGISEGKAELDAHAADSIRAVRVQLDSTVWADETLAQEYEDTFVGLWDALRKRQDRDAVLSGFAFGTLQLAELGAASARACDVNVRAQEGAARTLTHAAWQAFVKQFAADGYHLEECEFHHIAFERTDSFRRSTFSTVLHVRHDDGRRFVVKGPLRIRWSNTPGPSGAHVPDHIDARGLTVAVRAQPPGFVRLAELQSPDAAPGDLQPLLVHDLDGDGLSEVVAVGANTVFWNRGSGAFEPGELCKKPRPRPLAAVLADVTGDTHLDLVVAGERDHAFVYVGAQGGVFDTPPRRIAHIEALTKPLAMTAGDVDADGDLDLWISQYKPPYLGGQMPTPYYDANDGYPSYLLINHGDLRFEDGTEAAGLAAKRLRRTYANSFVDLDDDADLDLVVSSDFAGVDVYTNDGRGHFTDVTDSGIDVRENFGMSHVFGDFNGDAVLDFYVTGMSSTTARRLEQLGLGRDDYGSHQAFRMRMGYGNRMYLGVGGGQYRQAPFNDSVARTGWSWGTTALDLENDGDLDLYVANGHQSRESAKDYCTRFWCHDIYTGTSQESPQLASFFSSMGMDVISEGVSWNGFEHNKLLVNEGDDFFDSGYLMGVGFEFDSRAVVGEDLDADGRVDLLVVQAESLDPQSPPGERLHIMRNRWPDPGNWIGVRVTNSKPGRSPIGARVVVQTASGPHIQHVVNGDSFRAQHSNMKHFGLGDVEHVQAIEVTWQDGSVSRLEAPSINQYHDVD